MNRSFLYGTAAVAGLIVSGSAMVWSAQSRPPLGSLAAPPQAAARKPSSPNEEAWIVGSVSTAITGMARFAVPAGAGSPPLVKGEVTGHIWSPATYAPFAASLLGEAQTTTPDADHDVRTPLTKLTVEALLNQNDRLSALLTRGMRSASAHESAALLIGAHALREPSSMFFDVRGALSRMAAHLAIAQALRRGAPVSIDGSLAEVVLTVLAGRQRDGLTALDALEPRLTTVKDRAWSRAIRLRVTGDWRTPLQADATLLERLEYARALRNRAGSDALLDFLDTFQPEDITDWHRIALTDSFNLEAGHQFTDEIAERELAEAGGIWARLHGKTPTTEELLSALNAPPERSSVQRRGNSDAVSVLDWGMWAAFEQRQLAHGLTSLSRHLYHRAAVDDQKVMVAEIKRRFAGLTLYPVVLRWIALTPADYEQSIKLGRALVGERPEVVTVASWNFMAEKPGFVLKASPFPFVATWYTPAVPMGTAYDLHARALLPGCPRPPTREQAKLWAEAAPYDHWTQWSAEWLAVNGTPSVSNIRRAFGPLMQYDYSAPLKLIDYMNMSAGDQIAAARQLCEITTSRCDVLAELLVRDARESEAIAAYERWIGTSRDRVRVANDLTWLVRHYSRTGNARRAEELASMAAQAYSYGGLEIYAHLMDAQGRYDEAEKTYRAIAERYDTTGPLGTFTVRKAIRTGDKDLELKGWDLLRSEFPNGMERLALHALDVPPTDGMLFATFGRRPEAVGLRQTDIVVGVDEWRIRNNRQYSVVSRLKHDDQMTFTVWRGGRYQQIRARVPERWLGIALKDYAGGPATH